MGAKAADECCCAGVDLRKPISLSSGGVAEIYPERGDPIPPRILRAGLILGRAGESMEWYVGCVDVFRRIEGAGLGTLGTEYPGLAELKKGTVYGQALAE
jgi:hypothetical protein